MLFAKLGLRDRAQAVIYGYETGLVTPDGGEVLSGMSDLIPAEFAAWSLAWAEEFDGQAGAPADPRTWQAETGGHGWGNSELQYYTSEPANAALDGSGNLAITAARPGSRLATARYEGCQYTSARLITKNLRSFRYGLVQARIKLPPGRGIWPAFWMLGTSIDTAGWPGCGEIDVMENFGTSASVVHGTVHGPGYSGERGITGSFDAGAPLAAGFHAYSVCWEPGRIRWYAGQALYHTVTPADLHGRPWVFDHDFYLLINVAVGGRPSRAPGRSTAFPQSMLIDYIRVYTA
jgi:beta-glucanase (GH16 family)